MHARFTPRPAGDRKLFDPDFAHTGTGDPFAWLLVNADGLSAYAVRRQGRTVLDYTAEAARFGQAAAQLIALAPGRYRLSFALARHSDPAARPFWMVSCAGRTSGVVLRVDAALPGAPAGGAFTIPPDCPAQWLTFNLRASFAADMLAGETEAPVIVRYQAAPRSLN